MKSALALIGTVLVLGLVGVASAAQNAITPSTNDLNKANGMAYVDVTPGPGTATLTFHTSHSWYSCFEYRTDGDTSQSLSENGGANYNLLVTDGLYPYTCLHGGTAAVPVTASVTLTATHYVEVRMVFGAETDERFDWTRFDVLPPVATSKDSCKKDGWQSLTRSDSSTFKNQGDCVSYVMTGK